MLKRYKQVHNLKSNKQIAKRMNLSESAFSNQKSRGSLDLETLIKSCDPDVNLHWLLTGEGQSKTDSGISRVADRFSDYEASLNDLDNADIDEGDFLKFVLKQQEAVVAFLRKLEKKRSDD